MSPRVETDVVGRHGQVGVEVIPRDAPVTDMRLREAVDDMCERIDRPRAVSPLMRKGEVAVADTVRVVPSQIN